MSTLTYPPLTDAIIRKPENNPRDTEFDIPDGEQKNLKLTVRPSGLRQFTVRYRALDKTLNKVVQRRPVIGTWTGKPGSMTIKEARIEARRLQALTDKKADPVAEERVEQTPRTDTMAKLCELYIEKYEMTPKKKKEDQRVINKDIVPRLGNMAVRDIRRRHVLGLFEDIGSGKRKAKVQANRTKSLLVTIFNFGITREWLDANPALLIDKYEEKPRTRVLTEDEIRALWGLLDRFPSTEEKQAPGRKRATHDANGLPFCPFGPRMAAVQKLLLLTAKRGIEVVGMDWSEIDFETGWWTIPASRSKNGKPDQAWLIDEAIDVILAQAPNKEKPPKAGLVLADENGAIPDDRRKKAGAQWAKALGIDATSHDLRRTVATYMGKAGVANDHIGYVLNHSDGEDVTRIYNTSTYEDAKQAALETWRRKFRDIIANKTGEVVIFRRRERSAS